MAITGVTDVALTIQEVISGMLTKTLVQQSVALQMAGVWDRSGEVGPGMDTLDMIELAELAAVSVNENGSDMTPATISPAVAKLLLDQHISVPFSLTKRGDLQSRIALVQRTVENAIKTLGYGIDDYIFSKAVSNAGSTVTAAGADGLADVLGFKKFCDDNNVPREGRAIAASSEWMNNKLLASNTIQRANEYGSASAQRTGMVANVFGVDIFESTSSSLPSDGFVGLGAESIAFARQRAIEFQSQDQVLAQKTDYTVTHLFGAESTVATSNPRIFVYDPL
jgi:hypothetical protein